MLDQYPPVLARQSAATATTEQTLKALGGARPVLMLEMADITRQMLFKTQPGGDVAADQAALGVDVPVAGGTTLV